MVVAARGCGRTSLTLWVVVNTEDAKLGYWTGSTELTAMVEPFRVPVTLTNFPT